MKYLESIQETIYLSAGNAPQYRRIMRIFFIEYEKMHFQLYKEDVLELLREYPEFSDYAMEQLKTDLEVLVGWKNLTPIQDPKRVNCNNKIKILKKLGNLHKKTGCFLPDAGTVQPVFLYIFTKREKEGIGNKGIFDTIPNPFR